jgi:hypothetical protein
MAQVKSFVVLGDSLRRDLSVNVDATVNTWLKANPKIEEVEVSVDADLSTTYGKAFVVVKYSDPKPETKVESKEKK